MKLNVPAFVGLPLTTPALREEGYAMDTAAAGDEGHYKVESYDYDAIVLDVVLPRLDGWEVLERLRKRKRTPVLMLTASARNLAQS